MEIWAQTDKNAETRSAKQGRGNQNCVVKVNEKDGLWI